MYFSMILTLTQLINSTFKETKQTEKLINNPLPPYNFVKDQISKSHIKFIFHDLYHTNNKFIILLLPDIFYQLSTYR